MATIATYQRRRLLVGGGRSTFASVTFNDIDFPGGIVVEQTAAGWGDELYARFMSRAGRWVTKPTGLRRGQEAKALEVLRQAYKVAHGTPLRVTVRFPVPTPERVAAFVQLLVEQAVTDVLARKLP